MATALPDHPRAMPSGAALRRLETRRGRLPQRRFAIGGLVIIAALTYLVFSSFSAAVAAVVSPSQLLGRGSAAYGQTVRLQGRVAGAYGVNRVSLALQFHVSDGHRSVLVTYSNEPPGGFKTGASVEAQGAYNGRVFVATSLTAKCPTKYQSAAASQ